jgi:hypothetical protein
MQSYLFGEVEETQAVHLEVEGKSIAVGHPKCQAPSRVTHSKNPKGKRRKENTCPDVPPTMKRETDPSSSGATFLLVNVVWVKDVLFPSWFFQSTAIYAMGGLMYPADKC